MAKIKPLKNTSKKDFILKKAAQLFRSKGYMASSMRELADTVGVEAPSLYNYIGGKHELLQAICFKVAEQFIVHQKQIQNEKYSPIKKLEKIIRFHINIMLTEFDEVFVSNHDWKHLQNPHLTKFLNERRNYENQLMLLIEEGIATKVVKNINSNVAVFTILSAVRGLEFWQRQKKRIDKETLENDIVTHLLQGIIK